MHPCVVVVDMLQDNLNSGEHSLMASQGAAILKPIAHLLDEARNLGLPVVYANDSFLPGDFIFTGRMKPHALRSTPGAGVVAALAPLPGDHVLPKRRFSAFFKTDLDQTLRTLKADTVAICGITTTFCVLATAFDALSHDFSAVILRDCATAHRDEAHEGCLKLYEKNALWPLFRIMTSGEFLAECRERPTSAKHTTELR